VSVSLGMPVPPAPTLASRRKTRQLQVGHVGVGSEHPISVQSMTTTLTADVSLVMPDTEPPGAPPRVTARVTRDGKVQLVWGAAIDNGRIAAYRIRRAGRLIATVTGHSYVDKSPRPGRGSSVTYSVVALDLAGNAGPAGKARPLRAALLRTLTVANFRIASLTLGAHPLVRVKGTISDARAACRVRVGRGAWQGCRAKANGAFSVSLSLNGSQPVTLLLRDQLGRTKLQTLSAP
jgi:hypothetical protein